MLKIASGELTDGDPLMQQSLVKVLYLSCVFMAFLLGAALRCYDVLSYPLNFDEGATLYFARLPIGDLWGEPARLEPNPPLFYAVVHGVVGILGDGAGALRLASVAAGVLCIPVAGFIARTLSGPPAGVAAAFLVASSTAHVVTSQDARAYSLLTLAALVAIAAEVWLLGAYCRARQPEFRASIVAWAAYVLASITSLYLHNTAVLMLVALNMIALVVWATALAAQQWQRFALHWIAANLVVAGAYAFWLPIVMEQSVHTLANFWLPTPTLRDLRYGMMNVYAQPYLKVLQPFIDGLFLLAGLSGLVFYRRNRIVLGLAVGVILGVPAMTWLISQWRPLMNGKTLLWLVPVFLIFVALGCTYIKRFSLSVTAALVVAQLCACFSMFGNRPDEAYPEVAKLLQERVKQGDAIYLYPVASEILLDYYEWPRDKLAVYTSTNPDVWFRHPEANPIVGPIERELGNAERVWILTRSLPGEHRRISDRLSVTMTETYNQTLGRGRMRNLELSLFSKRP